MVPLGRPLSKPDYKGHPIETMEFAIQQEPAFAQGAGFYEIEFHTEEIENAEVRYGEKVRAAKGAVRQVGDYATCIGLADLFAVKPFPAKA